MPTGRPVRILLVEDHPADVALARKAFARIATPVQLHVVLDGLEAMQFLHRTGRHANAERPDLVFLDLNMPRMDGREVLREVDADLTLRSIPVIVLTTSAADVDVNMAYSLCANSYLTKPVTFDEFLKLVQLIELYWLQTALIPR